MDREGCQMFDRDGFTDAETRFQNLVQASPMGMHMYRLERNEDLVFEAANPAADRIIGLKHRDFVGQTIERVFPSLAQTNIPDTYRRIANHGGSWHDRQVVYQDMKIQGAFEVYAFQTEPRRMAALFLDVTERVRIEAELRAKTEELDRFFSLALDLWCIADLDGWFRRLNPAFEQVLGWSLEELLSRRFLDFVHPEDVEATQMALQSLASRQTVINFVNRYRCKDGTYRFLEWRSIPDASGQRLYAAARDISERVAAEQAQGRMEAQLRQAQKMESIGRLAGGVAHDFNNILTAIIGQMDLAKISLPPESPARRHLKEADKVAERATNLTRQLLAFSRKQFIEPTILHLNEIVREMHSMLARVVGEDVELAIAPEAQTDTIKADRNQIEQIIMNLAINARDAMPEGGTMTISTRSVFLGEELCPGRNKDGQPGPFVALSVSDTGCGMTEEVKSHLFEPFFTTKPLGKGTGLGLATVYGAASQNGAAIEVRSQVGRGTSFELLFPLAANMAAVREFGTRAFSPGIPRGTETILLAEDEPCVLEVAATILSSLGYKVLPCLSGPEALKRAAEFAEPIHFLMTDVIMPGMDGKELALRLSAERPAVRILYASGYTENIITDKGLAKDRVEFLAKPYNPQVLGRKVREVLDALPKAAELVNP